MPKPCPPTDSARCTPCSPCSAAACQYGGGFSIGDSKGACSTSDGATRATTERPQSAQALCAGVIAIGIGRLSLALVSASPFKLTTSRLVDYIGQRLGVAQPAAVRHGLGPIPAHGVGGVPGGVWRRRHGTC